MTRRLAVNVYVAGRFFAAGDVPDEESAALITNEGAWEHPRAPVCDDEEPSGSGSGFDPAQASVDEVNDYLAGADTNEVQRVLAAEAAGKARKGVLDGPYADPA